MLLPVSPIFKIGFITGKTFKIEKAINEIFRINCKLASSGFNGQNVESALDFIIKELSHLTEIYREIISPSNSGEGFTYYEH